MTTYNIQGKTALVTGANRGIGEAFVHYLIKMGAKKVFTAVRNLNNLHLLQAEYGDKVQALLLDVTNVSHINALAKNVDTLDLLVNNAGIANGCFMTSDGAINIARQEMDTHFFGPVQVTNALLPMLRKSPNAMIINISSIAGIGAMAGIGPYSASKAAMYSYIQSLRAEFHNSNLRVIGVYPGPTDTRMAEAWDMEKPSPIEVVTKVFELIDAGEIDAFPDTFSQQMRTLFLEHPEKMQDAFLEIA